MFVYKDAGYGSKRYKHSIQEYFSFTFSVLNKNKMMLLESTFFKILLMLLLTFPLLGRGSPVNFNQGKFVAGLLPTEEELKNAMMNQQPVELEDLFEGDIKLADGGGRNAIIGPSYQWPNAQIPYVISTDYSDAQRQVIATAMNEYHKVTCIRFVSRTTERDYIVIQKTGGGCYSYVGRQGGAQNVSLDDGCVNTNSIQHELMHAAGFWHEQSRYDRDDYVNIYWDNIQPDKKHNFNKYSPDKILLMGTPYNYKSIMHYTSYSFAISGSKPTITAIDGSTTGGSVFTQEDIIKLNRMYNCDPSDCWDDDIQTGNCAQLAAAGQCKSNVAEMMVRCKKSCNFCSGLITDGTPSTITNVVTSSTQSTESAVHSSTQTETEMTASTSRSSTVQSTTNRPSSVDCSTKPDGNYADTINPCSGSFVTCSNGRSYRMECYPKGLVFNPEKDMCDYPQNVYPCNGSSK